VLAWRIGFFYFFEAQGEILMNEQHKLVCVYGGNFAG
jgi:hypothetical protein